MLRVGAEVAPSQKLQTSGNEAQAAHGCAGLFCWVEGGVFFWQIQEHTPLSRQCLLLESWSRNLNVHQQRSG